MVGRQGGRRGREGLAVKEPEKKPWRGWRLVCLFVFWVFWIVTGACLGFVVGLARTSPFEGKDRTELLAELTYHSLKWTAGALLVGWAVYYTAIRRKQIPTDQHIEAHIRFLRTEEGGRRNPTTTGYRSQFCYANETWDVQHAYPDVAGVAPGDTVRTLLCFDHPACHRGRVYVGMPFDIRNGENLVGRGVITKILHL